MSFIFKVGHFNGIILPATLIISPDPCRNHCGPIGNKIINLHIFKCTYILHVFSYFVNSYLLYDINLKEKYVSKFSIFRDFPEREAGYSPLVKILTLAAYEQARRALRGECEPVAMAEPSELTEVGASSPNKKPTSKGRSDNSEKSWVFGVAEDSQALRLKSELFDLRLRMRTSRYGRAKRADRSWSFLTKQKTDLERSVSVWWGKLDSDQRSQ